MSTHYVPGTGCHVSPGDLGFRGLGPAAVTPAICADAARHCSSRALPGTLASGRPLGVELGRWSSLQPQSPVCSDCTSATVGTGRQDGPPYFGLATPHSRSPLHPAGSRMMSRTEQWPIHGSSRDQRLGPELVPLGGTWSGVQGGTKLGCSTGLRWCEIMLSSPPLLALQLKQWGALASCVGSAENLNSNKKIHL